MSRVIVVGSANTDLTVRVQTLPSSGETVIGHDLRIFFGGKGANQALAALRCGAEVLLLARIGTDHYGRELAQHLTDSGLPAAGILTDEGHPSGLAFILIEANGNNQITVVPGSNQHLTPADINTCADWFTPGSVLLTQLEIPLPTVAAALELAKSSNMTTILNPAPYAPLPAHVLAKTDILTPNQAEAEALSSGKVKNKEEIAQKMRTIIPQGPKNIIVTLGSDGALLVSMDRQEHIPAYPVQAVDTVGAGDAFNGVLAAALANGWSIGRAVRLASAAGALATTKSGAQDSLPSHTEVEDLSGLQLIK
jgi:ribokinase